MPLSQNLVVEWQKQELILFLVEPAVFLQSVFFFERYDLCYFIGITYF